MAIFRRKGKGVDTASGRAAESTDEVIIDLREPTHAPGELVWGMPSRCPECGDFGYLDKVDVGRGVMYQHCPSCWAKWEITEAQTQTHDTAAS